MDFKNSDIANGAAATNLNGADASASLDGAALVQLALQAGNIMPLTADGQLVLPAGVGLDDIKVVGRDLVIQMPDGTQMIVPDGAIFVPQIVVEGVAVPPLNIAALLIGQEPQPAAGRPQSSGGNFADAVGDIGDPFDLGDLLPPTALAFPEPEVREIVPGLIDRDPDVLIQDGGPAGRDVVDNVSETGLPGTRANGNVETPGSAAGNGSDTTTGTIIVTSPDGVASITINGVTVTGVAGQQIITPRGVLTLGAQNGDQIGYTYRLTDNTSGDATNDVFVVTVTDPDGDVATARLTINITDDGPTARNDTDTVAGGTFGPELGNVLSGAGTTSGAAGADTLGADGAVISGFRAGASGNFASTGTTINGQYGTLTLGANGNYTYVRNVNTPGGVTDVFTYQLTDGDGDASTATLTINIGDAPNRITFIPVIGEGTIVREPHLPARDGEPAGSQFDGNPESTSGTITFNSPDGVGSVTVAGVVLTPGALPQQVITNAIGTLVVTGYAYNPVTGVGSITYVYTLNDNTLNTNGESVSFPVVVTDLDGDAATENLVINIVDDAPLAANDSGAQQSENAAVAVNVFVNDVPGADGVNLNTGVAVVAGSLTGAGGLVYNNNGSFTYTPAAGEEGVVTFQYTITDGDGDISTATVTITLLADSAPSVEVSGENIVAEAGLPAGSDADADSETTSGTIAIATGGDTLASIVINGVNVTAGGSVVGASGTLTVSVSEGVYSYSYTLADNTSGDTTTDSFNVVITDSDGDSANDTLVIAIQDDVPTAVDDTDSIAAGTYGPATGNVLTDAEGDGGADTQGADGAVVTAVTGSAAGTVGGTTAGTYGVLTLNADGSYSYARNPGTDGGVSDVFIYTLTDADGDTSTATLTISIADSPTTLDLPIDGEAGTLVDEAGLPAGSDAASTRETTSGTIAYVAPDGPATVTIDGVAVTVVGQTVAGSFGTLTVTSIANGAVGYSYTLTTNTSGDATFEDFAVVITDQDGDASNGTLVIDITDDVPTARADIDSVTEDGPTVADGNVITGANVADANNTDGVADTQGADSASVTAIAFGANSGTVGSALAGTYGTLTLTANGNYSYALDNTNPAVQGLDGNDTLTEVFTYTITDGDSDPSTTTLTVTINGSDDPITINGLNAEGPDRIVDEDDLSDGSSPDNAALTQTGSFTVNGVDGIASIKIGGTETSVNQTFTNAYGTFTITSISAPVNGSSTAITVGYSYTLTDNTAHANANGQNFITETFSVEVTDTDGSTDTDQVEVRIIDDVPTAVNDTDTIAAGSNLPAVGNVITDAEADGGKDIAGADAVVVTAIVGPGAVAGTVGGTTAGTYGVLTLNANGSYSYTRNDGTPGNVQDVFTYTITDGDGDTSTATLTINIQDDRPIVGTNAVVLLDDDALTGGNPGGTGDDADAANLTGTLSGSGGDGALTFAFNTEDAPAGFTYVAGPSGSVLVQQGGNTVLTVTLNSATGAYTVVQNAPITHPAGADENNAPFTLNYTVTDVDGDAASGTLAINVDDDTPTARADIDGVTEGGAATGNVLTGADTTSGVAGADTAGADGFTVGGGVVGVRAAGADTTTAVAGGTGAGIAGLYGTLTLGANGSYTYVSNANAVSSNQPDVFVYTVRDADGDLSTTTLTLNVANVTVTATDTDALVNEAGLATGSNPSATSEIFSGAITPAGGVGAYTYTLTTPATGAYGNFVLNANGTYTYTLTKPFDTSPDANNGTNTEQDRDSFGYTVTDANGNTTTGTILVDITDDVPTVTTSTAAVPTLTVDETVFGSDASASFAGLFTTSFGADGAGATAYKLGVVAGPSGLTDTLTGQVVNLVLTAGGVVEGRTAISNELVFTVAVDGSGTVTLDQSRAVVHSPNLGPDQPTTLSAANLITLTATSTDGDGDTASAVANIATALVFKDDAPAIDAAVADADTVLLTTQDAETIFGFDTAVSAANFSGAFSITSSSYGADGAGTTTWAYALSITDANTGLTSNGVAITLTPNAGVIEGRAGGALIFTLVTNPTTGVVTLTQFAEVDHVLEGTNTSPFDDQFAVLAVGKVALTGTATIVDKDGDSASEAVVLDLGGNVRFADDGPTVTLSTAAVPTLTVDETVFATNASASFAGLFTTDYGADGAGTTAYTLGFNAGATGLVDTATNLAVVLSLVGGQVVGTAGAGGPIVFTVSVAADGTVTLDQSRAVVHAPENGPDQSTTPLAANLITLTATSTDGDGDIASATANIGNTLTFKDDAPAIDASVVDANTVLLTTQDAQTIGSNTDTAVSVANFSGAFSIASSSYGADGAGTTTWAYTLSVTNATSGLSSNGVAITLVQNGTTVEGKAGSAVIFSLATDPTTGVVTLTQFAEIDHAVEGTNTFPFDDQLVALAVGKVALTGTATIVDKDGDSISDAVVLDLGGNVRFADDGPVVTASTAALPAITVDETVLATDASANLAGFFTTNFGADGAGTTAYRLGVVAGPSGLIDIATGQAVNLFLNGTVVEGRTAGSNAVVFTVTVDGSGVVTLDQQRAVSHLPNTNADQPTTLSAANLITLTATSTDGDGDTASATLSIGKALVFEDDGPTIDIAASGTTLIVDESLGTTGSTQNEGGRANNDETLTGAEASAIGFATGSIVSLVSVNAGADGEASRVYALNVNNTTSGLLDSVTNSSIVLFAVNATTVEGRVGNNAGPVSFRISIDPATGSATINQFRAVEHNDSTNHDENGGSEAVMNSGTLSLGVTLTDRDGDQGTDSVDISQLFKFEDDGPAAIGESGTTNEILKDFNTAFVIDFSGSINNTELNTQLVAVKAAITELFNSTGGNVSVNFVLFASNATASATFTTAAAANTYLDSVNPATGGTRPSGVLGNTTDFSAAITTLLANYAADETADNQVFFLSDGNPNENQGGSGQALNDTIRPLWNSFVNNNDINVTAIGVGDGINNSNLQQIDVDGAGTPILVANFDDLIATLVALFTPTPITGDLDVNDDFGTDGGRILSITVPTAAVTDPVYTWNGLTGAASQITVSGGGAAINGFTSILVQTEIGGQFVIDFATGAWSYTPPRNVPADRTEVFNYTIVDGDGDTATAALSVLVENNDLPATAAVTATVDDDGLTGGNAGGTGDLDANVGEVTPSLSEAIYNGTLNITATDNPIAAISFAQLQGTTAVIGLETVTYSWNAVTNLLSANISASPAGRTGTLFTVQLNNPSNGSYTVTLRDNVLHSNVAGENDASVALTYRVADTDGSTNTGVLNITFDDDTPVAFDPQDAAVLNTNIAPTPFALNYNNAVGADGLGNVVFNIVNGAPAVDSAGNALKFNGEALFIFGNGTNVLTARTSVADGSDVAYTITIVPGTNQYLIDVNGTISNGTEFSINNLTSSAAGNVDFRAIGADNPASVLDIILSGRGSGGAVGSVNTDSDSIGIDNQSVGAGEAVRIDFVSNLQTAATTSGLSFTDHTTVTTFTQTIPQVQGAQSNTASIRVSAIRADNDQIFDNTPASPEAGETVVTITSVRVQDYASGTWFSFAPGSASQAGASVTFNVGGSVTISGLQEGDRYEINTASAFSAVVVEGNAGTTEFDLGIFSVVTINTAAPIAFDYDVTGTDADGDSIFVPDAIKVVLNPVTPPVALDLDGDGVEFVSTAAGVIFDYAGDGSAERTAWVGADDGLLVLDRNGDGVVNDGSEIVFARDGLTDLQGLAADYDSNRDGVLDANDANFAQFGVWQDANSNGVTDAGEYRSLLDAGIVSIGLVSDGVAYSAANGEVSVAGQSLYNKADGSTGIVADAAFATGGAVTAATRASDQLRTSNVTTSVIAAALVGLAVEENVIAAPDGNLGKAGDVVSEYTIAANDAEPTTSASDQIVTPFASGSDDDFVQKTSDVVSSYRAADDADKVSSFQDAPMSQRSALLEDSIDPVSEDQSGSAFSFGGGDQVMHSMLDIAAFAAPEPTADNVALPLPIEDAVREAMPDLMVDRLIDAFTADVGTPASEAGGGAGNSELLAGMLDQGIDAFHISGMANNDLSGAHQYEMATINHG